MAVRTFTTTLPVDLALTLSPLRRGGGDPCMKILPSGVWRATNTPEGPATVRLRRLGSQIEAEAWGPGSSWVLDGAPELVGGLDSLDGFEPLHPVVTDAHRRHPGLRPCRSQAVTEALVPTILEQKVIGQQATRSYAQLVRRLGSPAPGPAGLLLPPTPEQLSTTPSYAFHPLNVERKRADTVRLACRHAGRLDQTAHLPRDEGYRRLTALPGVGPWSAAEVAAVAWGDADAVSVGDYHLPGLVSHALAGEIRGDDDRMLELLAPYAGHRWRVIRLIALSGAAPPRFGPRMPLQHIAKL